MCFKVKATVIGFVGDEKKYPCHFQYKMGDEVIFDGERCHGRVCPEFWPVLIQKVYQMYLMGPRYVEPSYYYPIWYVPNSVPDQSMKKFDGLGFSSVYENYKEDRYSIAQLAPPNSFKWPPHPERTINKNSVIMCSDLRTCAMMKIEAIDIADKGFYTPYFRRQMTIMSRVLPKQGMLMEKILNEFSEEEKMKIYPPLSKEILTPLVEELEVMNYVEIKDGKISVTDKGKERLQEFINSLPAEDRAALKL